MTRDPVYASELAHDTAGADPTPFMQAALDDIVEQLMSGEKVRGLAWDLRDCLADYFDLPEILSAAIVTGDFEALKAAIERHVRLELTDHDAVHDLAAELAAEPDEQS